MPRAPANGAVQRHRGDQAEALAERYLLSLGGFVLARNFIGRRGELDLVVAFGETIAIVEVRRRKAGTDAALESLTETKRKRVVRAAREYLEKAALLERPIRFDLVAVGPSKRGAEPEFVHVEAAFDASGVDD